MNYNQYNIMPGDPSALASGLISGVHREPLIRESETLNNINNRIQSRHFPDFPLEPNFSSRPVSTKYNLLPSIAKNSNPAPTIPIKQYVHHIPQFNFNPATKNGPWKTYATNVDTESILRNQTIALQKSSQAVYVPSSDSDLYNVHIVSNPVDQVYGHLFDKPTFERTVHPNLDRNIGKDRFNNDTRLQLRQPL
jgi:hypothetical protein